MEDVHLIIKRYCTVTVNLSIKGLNKMSNTKKILETMNS